MPPRRHVDAAMMLVYIERHAAADYAERHVGRVISPFRYIICSLFSAFRRH